MHIFGHKQPAPPPRPRVADSLGVEPLAARIMDRYDRNQDGAISLLGHDDSEHPEEQSERVVTQNCFKWTAKGELNYWGYNYRRPYLHTEQLSMGPFLLAADQDGDHRVSPQDITTELQSYDQDHNGRLERQELLNLMTDFPESRTQHSRNLEHSFSGVDMIITEKFPGSDNHVVNFADSIYSPPA